MLKTFATNVVVSKGYDGAPALKYSENGESVRFRIGKKVYDSRVEGNYRWINISVKAFGDVCNRIRKMKLKEGSFLNLVARLDEEKWKDKDTGYDRSMFVLIVEDIEYAYVGKSGENQKSNPNQSQRQSWPDGQYQQAPPVGATPMAPAPMQPAFEEPAPNPMESDNFMGFEAFGGDNFFQE